MADSGLRVRAEDREFAVAFDLFEERRLHDAGIETVRFDRLLEEDWAIPALEVFVEPPKWRGHSFVDLLEWVVCSKLSRAGETLVRWRAHKKGGASGVRKVLDARGWNFEAKKNGNFLSFEGFAPAPGPRPEPAGFDAHLADRELHFAADWGVFSEDHIDDGTRMLFDVVREAIGGRVSAVADIGCGYGPLAIGLVTAGVCEEAVAVDTDFVAIKLARTNAAACGAAVRFVAEDDPSSLPSTPLTVSYPPTHADASNRERLVDGLVRRSIHGEVFVVVHSGLEERYAALFAASEVEVVTVARARHSVLRFG